MIIEQLQSARLKPAYNILCQSLLAPQTPAPPFGATWCVVEPGNYTTPHAHTEGETFLITRGRGRMIIDAEEQIVTEGDLVIIPSHRAHQIRNEGTDNLEFLSLYWNHAVGSQVRLFAAPPTPNGTLHLGHLSGPYLAADILKRSRALFGKQGIFITGTDDYQSYVQDKAIREKSSPQDITSKYRAQIAEALELSAATPDIFYSPSGDKEYQTYVQGFFDGLLKTPHVQIEETSLLYCESCEQHLYEVGVQGNCPHCEAQTYGNNCESCGLPNQCTDLKSPTCRTCDSSAQVTTAQVAVFKPERLRKELVKFYETMPNSPAVSHLLYKILAKPLPNIVLSYPTQWGIEIPDESLRNQRIHAWCEMAGAYDYMAYKTRGLSPSQNAYVFGFDNMYYYAVIVPALLMAIDRRDALPNSLVMNEFLHLEGEKFSTSRNHAIWIKEAVAQFGSDVLRGYLAVSNPKNHTADFKLAEFEQWVNRVGVQKWEGWIAQLNHAIETKPSYEQAESESLNQIQKLAFECMQTYQIDHFSPPATMRTLEQMVSLGIELAAQSASLQSQLTLARVIGVLAQPILPGLGQSILEALGESTSHPSDWLEPFPMDKSLQPITATSFSDALSAFTRGDLHAAV